METGRCLRILEGHSNGVVSVATPGDGSDLETMLEWMAASGRSTGLVTTTAITHATPAAFGAHAASRSQTGEIATDYLTQTMPKVTTDAAMATYVASTS